MGAIEQAFTDAETAAESARKAASSVVARARAMTKAAQEGNIGGLRKAQNDLGAALAALAEEVRTARDVWRWSPEQEEAYLGGDYAGELRTAAEEAGVALYERDGYLVAYPSLVRIQPGDRTVRVDRKNHRTLRPSFLARFLLRNQQKRSGFKPERLLEQLCVVYDELVRGSPTDLGGSSVVPLARIYKLMTALPGVSRDYDRTDFARDIYTLNADGPQQTRRGRTVSFPASTGTRRRSDIFSFVAPNGENHEYYGIKFSDRA
ncbi:MAG: hypothetical protein OXH09_24395 [Gammaproteobacteria bacterium]|nr:hypothetical protein [Gammaproteobacteria bacterium]